MKKFNSLKKTKFSKRKYNFSYSDIYRKGKFATSVDYSFFENRNANILLEANKKKKMNKNLVTLWGILDIRTFIDLDLGNTINYYFLNDTKPIPVKNLKDYNYMYEPARKLTLLDIKYIKKLKINSIIFKDIYMASYEIMDQNKNYRPYVLLFTQNEFGKFEQKGYGYDTNNNGNIELFINTFNYPIFLTENGILKLPLTNKSVKLKIHDYITENDIKNLIANMKN